MATKAEEVKNSDVEVTTSLAPGLAAYLTAWATANGITLGQFIREQTERTEYQCLEDEKGHDLIEGIFPGISAETHAWITHNRSKAEEVLHHWVDESELVKAKAEVKRLRAVNSELTLQVASITSFEGGETRTIEWDTENRVTAYEVAELKAKVAAYERLFDFSGPVVGETHDVEVTVTLPPALAAYLTQWGKGRGESLGRAIRTTVEDDVYSFIDNDDGADVLQSLVPGIDEEVRAWHDREFPGRESEVEGHHPIKAENPLGLAHAGASNCIVVGCEVTDAEQILRIQFPDGKDQLELLGKSFLLELPMCQEHARIFRASETTLYEIPEGQGEKVS